jgi:hypothetical protein
VAQFETEPLPLGAILKSTRSLHGYRVQGFSSVADRNRPGNGDEIARSGDYIVQAMALSIYFELGPDTTKTYGVVGGRRGCCGTLTTD